MIMRAPVITPAFRARDYVSILWLGDKGLNIETGEWVTRESLYPKPTPTRSEREQMEKDILGIIEQSRRPISAQKIQAQLSYDVALQKIAFILRTLSMKGEVQKIEHGGRISFKTY